MNINSFDPVVLAFIAGMSSYFMTAAGAALVFFFKKINMKLLNTMLLCFGNYDCGLLLVSTGTGP